MWIHRGRPPQLCVQCINLCIYWARRQADKRPRIQAARICPVPHFAVWDHLPRRPIGRWLLDISAYPTPSIECAPTLPLSLRGWRYGSLGKSWRETFGGGWTRWMSTVHTMHLVDVSRPTPLNSPSLALVRVTLSRWTPIGSFRVPNLAFRNWTYRTVTTVVAVSQLRCPPPPLPPPPPTVLCLYLTLPPPPPHPPPPPSRTLSLSRTPLPAYLLRYIQTERKLKKHRSARR